MRKYIVAIANILIILTIMVILVTYSSRASAARREDSLRKFEDTTVGMVQTTSNYLHGAQQVANSWGHYINAEYMTMEEAISFLRKSLWEEEDLTAQVLYVESQENVGRSTHPDIQDPDNYTVRYRQDTLFLPHDSAFSALHTTVDLTRMFTNQINGKQSVGFYHALRLRSADTGLPRSGVVLFVVPVSNFDKTLRASNSYFDSMDTVIVTRNGDYISKSQSFKNSNVFEFLKSYNDFDKKQLEDIQARMRSGHGVLPVKNSLGEKVYLGYAADETADGFIVVTMLREQDLVTESRQDIVLPLTIGIGLLILFCFNIIVLGVINSKLTRAVKEAKTASLAKTEFLSTMSHDIRTPLNAILGFTELARQQPGATPELAEDLSRIAMAGDHLLMLINDILDISQIEHHSVRLDPSSYPVEGMLSTLESIGRPIAEEKGLTLDLSTRNIQYPYVDVDQLRLNQIYVNLVGNALKYTNEGGVTVVLEELAAKAPGMVLLRATISDTGIGMSPDFLPVMYDTFVRQEDSRVSKTAGTGLGLAITKHLVDLMGGTIQCQSQVGQGTTFVVELPVPIAQAPAGADAAAPSQPLGHLRLLVAEDNDLNWEIISSMLKLEGFSAQRAVNGLEAVDLLRADPTAYDLVLMDLRMPVMDGLEATRQLRADSDPRLRAIPIIALSADAFTENIRECLAAGMNAHVAKPVNLNDLIKTIEKVKGGV